MGAPDPFGIKVDEVGDRVTVQYYLWDTTNRKSREARAIRILRLIGPKGEG